MMRSRIANILLSILLFVTPCLAQVSPSVTKSSLRRVFASSEIEVLNPSRGIYRFRPLAAGSDFASVRNSGATLIYAELDLAPFKKVEISAARLDDVTNAFIEIERAGVKAIVRPVYAHAIGEDDAPLEIIARHMKQLRPIFERYAHVIYTFQAGCLGAWGEWHSSTKIPDTVEERNKVIRLLLDHLPVEKQIHLRRPIFKIDYASTNGTGVGRLGHHNDCILANATDSGTYAPELIDEHRTLIASESRSVGFGGETCQVNEEYSACAPAVKLFRRLGMSYLNADYHPDVLEGFRRNNCWQTIVNHLGYRFEPVRLLLTARPSGGLNGELALKNTGWAPLYEKYYFTIRARQNGATVDEQRILSFDSTALTPGEVQNIIFSIDRDLGASPTELTLSIVNSDSRLTQNSDYAIRLASKETPWDKERGENILASFSLQHGEISLADPR